jgi:hypothetical protein
MGCSVGSADPSERSRRRAISRRETDRSEFLTRLVETYDRRKAAALFSAFKRNGTWQVPTFGALRSVWDARRAQLNPADAAATDSAAKKTVEMFADMRKAGVKVLAGSDLPVSTGVPPLHDELVALVRAGMTPLEALQASTRNASEFIGRIADEGRVCGIVTEEPTDENSISNPKTASGGCSRETASRPRCVRRIKRRPRRRLGFQLRLEWRRRNRRGCRSARPCPAAARTCVSG